jgi:hypothetical protein
MFLMGGGYTTCLKRKLRVGYSKHYCASVPSAIAVRIEVPKPKHQCTGLPVGVYTGKHQQIISINCDHFRRVRK